MKNKILLSLFILTMIIMVGFPTIVEARMPPIFPIWGYNSADHICQIKQESETASVRENLTGDYWSLRECRRENPQIIFYTGEGILIWFGIFVMIFLSHYFIFPKLEKRTRIEKVLFSLQDIAILGVILFFVILLFHYFDVPSAFVDYQSDIDHIIYQGLIRPELPIKLAGLYIVVSLARGVFLYRKKKK